MDSPSSDNSPYIRFPVGSRAPEVADGAGATRRLVEFTARGRIAAVLFWHALHKDRHGTDMESSCIRVSLGWRWISFARENAPKT
jgi:hypothetical protein